MSDPPQLPKGNLNELSVPSAPYPPMHLRTPPRSSLSSSPHYSASYVHRNSDPTSSPSAVRLGSGENNEDADNTGISLAYGELPKSYSEQPKTPRATPVHASQIKILPQWNNVIACINCIQSQPILDPTLLQEPPVIRKRKVGPMLLELRRLELSSINSDQGDGSFFTTRSIAFSRGNPSLGTSVASTCLDLPTVQTYSGTQSSQMPMAAATGLTTGMLAIHSFGNDTDEENLLSSSIEYYHTPRHHRQASAVAWRPNNFNHVVIGLLGSNTAGPQQASGPRRGGQSNRAGGDREFCCFLWDIETQQSSAKRNVSPVSKLSHNAPVASLAWMLDGQTLAIGGQSRNIQLYDMKVSGTNVPPISAYAHNFGVHGIEVCPHRPHLMATFCRAIGEPVKLWDIRRMDSVVSEIKISGLGAGAQASNSSASQIANQRVEAVKWASLEPGTLSVAICDSVQDFDTNSGSRPTLIRVNHHMKGEQTINDFALYGGPSPTRKGYTVGGEDSDQSNRLIEEIYPRRMLAVLEDKTVCDMAKHTYAPVAISRRDGRLVHALGAHVWVGSTTFGPAAMEKNFINEEDDISATMMGRARCLRKARYSMDTASNIKMLSEEIPRGESFTDGLSARFTLLRLWSWIDRVESLCEDAEDIEDDSLWPARGLLDAGIWNLLGMETEGEVDKVLSCPTLGVEFYRNSSRQAALASCGWAGKFDLINVLAECEALGEYERSAALAGWHGDIGAAVSALQRAAEVVRLRLAGKGGSEISTVTPEYAETLDLTAMCIAGFPGSSASRSRVWQSACLSLLRRNDLSESNAKTSQMAYLRALCQFLLNIGKNDSFDQVLENPYLSLCDRVAFACRFLERTELKSYLLKCVGSCQLTGDVEGLVVTGLSKAGIKILQSFVDRFADVQTAALVVSRAVLPSDWTSERKICIEWVEAYRGLLNTWQMWQSRAMFDVDRAEVLRRIKAKTVDGISSGGAKTVPYPSRRLQVPNRRQGPRPPDPDVLASIPAQLDARCNYCSSPLGLRRHEGNATQWLSKMKPVLSCCPQCRKPLPRCAVCLLSLGCLNPYMELTRERSRSGLRGGASDDLSSLANLPFAEWFTWCMRCKHGGHAHHLVGWFANHETCPVSGCECQCQFDGIQKLNRPALAQNASVIPPAQNLQCLPVDG